MRKQKRRLEDARERQIDCWISMLSGTKIMDDLYGSECISYLDAHDADEVEALENVSLEWLEYINRRAKLEEARYQKR